MGKYKCLKFLPMLQFISYSPRFNKASLIMQSIGMFSIAILLSFIFYGEYRKSVVIYIFTGLSFWYSMSNVLTWGAIAWWQDNDYIFFQKSNSYCWLIAHVTLSTFIVTLQNLVIIILFYEYSSFSNLSDGLIFFLTTTTKFLLVVFITYLLLIFLSEFLGRHFYIYQLSLPYILRFLFFATPIFWHSSIAPKFIYTYNPLYYILNLLRDYNV